MDEQVHMSAPPRIGLALGSGLARGFAHLGVVRALKRHGIEPTIISGTSMGALVGGAYLANRLDAVEEWAYTLTKFKVLSYLDFRVKSSGGLIGGERLMKLMLDNFGDVRVEDLPNPFIAITADLVTGHEVWLRKGRLVDVMRASFSLPGIFPPMYMNNRWLIDGALVNPVPVSACTAAGARMTIAVNVSGDIIGKARRPGDSIPTVAGFDLLNFEGPQAVEEVKKQGLIQRVFRREANSPSIFGVMVSALNIVQDRLARSRLAGDPPDVLIVPRIGHIGLMEFDRAEELIAEGEAAVERAMPDIKAAYAVLCTQYGEDDGTANYSP
ncbi:MAG: patatin-like phospholipase family protein [Alphaproteobacteria bacterium]|nr:patatin-like phospholipase family protein [Alphaproteobacteria bacterium]